MPTFTFTSPDGKKYDITGPDGATQEQAFEILQKQLGSTSGTPESKKKEPTWFERAKAANESGDPSKAGLATGHRIVEAAKQGSQELSSLVPFIGATEAGMKLATGLGSSIAGGLAGLASMPFQGSEKASNLSQQIQQAATYQPRTGMGKLLSELPGIPLGAAKQGMREMGGDVGGMVGPKSRVAGEEIGGIIPDVAGTLMGGAGALKGAKNLATLQKEAIPGKDFSPLRDLTPEQQARFKALTDKGIKPTLAQITRDPEQWRFEEQTAAQSATKPGAALTERKAATDAALLKAVNSVDEMMKGKRTTKTEPQTGLNVASTLEKKADNSLKNVGDLYNKARESGETKALVDTSPIEKFLSENDAQALSVPSLKSIKAKLRDLQSARTTPAPTGMRDSKGNMRSMSEISNTKDAVKISIDDMEELRKAANSLSNPSDKPSMHFMGGLKKVIDQTTQGAGGKLYQEARQARLAHAMEFEDRAGIARLIEKKTGSRTDYKTPTEDVFKKTMLNGSDEELRDVIRSLKDIDLKKDPSGAQALRNLQGQTIDYLLEKSTRLTGDSQSFSPIQFKKAVDSIGVEKLNDLLGANAVKTLQETLNAGKLAKDKPGAVSGSDTMQNFRDYAKQMVMNEGKKHILGNIPLVGGIARAVGEFAEGKAAERATQARTNQALNPRMASPETLQKLIQQSEEQANQQVSQALRPATRPVPLSILMQSAQPRNQGQE